MTFRSLDAPVARSVAVAAWLAAPVTTLILFLILYNNFESGWTIVAVLAGLNLALFGVVRGRHGATAAYCRSGAACVIGLLAALAALEVVFLAFFPAEYARIRDLSKGIRTVTAADGHLFPVVFTNGSVREWRPAAVGPDMHREPARWNMPGEEFEYYGYEPNEKFKYVNIVRWNAHGYYDRDYPYAKPPGVYRIVFLGDSYVEAAQVPLMRSFHKVLERALNEEAAHWPGIPRRFEVIALGHSGTGHESHYNILRERAILYNPDAVAATLCTNDFCDDDPALQRERTLADGDVTPELRSLARHGYLGLAFALRRYNELQKSLVTISPELLQWSAENIPRVEAGWGRTFAAVLAERDFCRARGVKYALVYLCSELELKYALDPTGTLAALSRMHGRDSGIAWDVEKSQRRVEGFCREHGVYLISMTEPLVLAQRQTGKLVYGDHFTFFGHEAAAGVLKAGLIPLIYGTASREASAHP